MLHSPQAQSNKNLLPFSKFCGGDMDWIDLAQDRDRWGALVNAVMNLQVT